MIEANTFWWRGGKDEILLEQRYRCRDELFLLQALDKENMAIENTWPEVKCKHN